MTITRLHGEAKGRSRATIHNGIVYTVATDPHTAPTVAEQTRNSLAFLETSLEEAGSGKERILQATVYLTDMDTKPEMDAVWCEWIGPPENWPQRACVGTDLVQGDLVEIVLVAAVR